MSTCALSTDYSFNCDVGAGGNKLFWLIELEKIATLVESSGGEGGTITTITKVTGAIFRKYQLVLETASTDEAITGDRKNGTLFFAQTAVIVINKQQVLIRNEIKVLAKNNLVLIAQDNNNTYRMYGRENGLRLQTGDISSGVAWADRNGYTLNLTGFEREPAPFVDESVIATLQIPGT